MIGYLNGTVLEAQPGNITLLVANGTIGYSVHVPQNVEALSLHAGQKLELYIYTHVREDVLDLFGFFKPIDKTLFLMLLNVNGVGPKLALSLISNLSATELTQAIAGGQKEKLTAISGVGKKTAERLILELQEKFKKVSGQFPAGASSKASAPVSTLKSEALAVLTSLGYKAQDLDSLLDSVLTDDSQIQDVEAVIPQVLKRLSKKSKSFNEVNS